MNPQERLIEFVRTHQIGGCKILSQGDSCICPLCDISKISDELRWYRDEAAALAYHFKKGNDLVILASLHVLVLDAGKRADSVLQTKEAK